MNKNFPIYMAHLTGFMSLGLFIYYMFLLVRGCRHDRFNWQILIWILVIGMVRIAGWVFFTVK